MKFDLTVDTGPCNTDLRTWCLGIAAYWLFSVVVGTILGPTVIGFITLVIVIVTNGCLILGCIRFNHMLVGVWLIFALLWAIGFPFSLLGTIFHYGGYRESTGFSSLIPALLVYIILFILMLLSARIVYSYYLQLKNRQSNPQHSVVV
ncbi:hypothetical protein KR222_008418 [Zaprionus bogoriensis]|nr:hypothetical protein KR222_008418 [Zaprionus bogoriensis]